MKRLFCILFVLLLTLQMGVSALSFADSYEGHGYNSWERPVAQPNGYMPSFAVYADDIGVDNLKDPSDMFIDRNGNFLIADTGNNRILILDENLRFKKEISQISLPDGGDPYTLKSPKGVFADKLGNIFIADTENFRVLKVTGNGKLIQEFGRPDDSMVSEEKFEYKPSKILVDDSGVLYVLIDGLYRGAISFDKEGVFLGFFASNTVRPTGTVLLERFLRLFMTKEQIRKQIKNIPVEYTNFDLDDKNFIFTCSSSRQDQSGNEQIKKINYAGRNIFKRNAWAWTSFGAYEVYYKGSIKVTSSFIDLNVDDDGFVSALDNQYGRVYQYDKSTNETFIFGGKGDELGTFRNPVAIESNEKNVFVLDKEKANITVFELTEFGSKARNAINLYNEGKFVESLEPWQEIVKTASNYSLAYVGMGKAYYQLGNYKEAMNNYEAANRPDLRAVAFTGYRSEFIKANFKWMALIGAAIIVVLIVVFNLLKRYFRKKGKAR